MNRNEFLKLIPTALGVVAIGLSSRYKYTYYMGEGCSPNYVYLFEEPEAVLNRLFNAETRTEIRPVRDGCEREPWEYRPGNFLRFETHVPTEVFELTPGLWVHAVYTPDGSRIDALNRFIFDSKMLNKRSLIHG